MPPLSANSTPKTRVDLRTHSAPTGSQPANKQQPQTVYCDWADLEAKMSARQVDTLSRSNERASHDKRRRLITTVESETDGLRANVKDSAKAILRWISAVADHDAKHDLDTTLNRCLRPGPDLENLNYAGLAQEIRDTLKLDISAKRIRTAVQHLRQSHRQKATRMQQDSIKQKLDALQARLEVNYAALTASEQPEGKSLRRTVAIDVLAAVRRAASRLIACDYGEGIPQTIDLDRIEDEFLDFVRDVIGNKPAKDVATTLAEDLHRLLVTLCDYDRSADSDMRLVVDGSRVVAETLWPQSLPGLIAQLNVLVTGRSLLETDVYCSQMISLAQQAAGLHADTVTRSLMNWVRRLPEDQRLPSPLRVSSYCLNNAATHMLERLFTGAVEQNETNLEKVKYCLDEMSRRDSGFRLIKTTEVIYLTVLSKASGHAREIESHFTQLGPSASLSLLEDLARFESCVELVHAAKLHAIAAIPELKGQLINIR